MMQTATTISEIKKTAEKRQLLRKEALLSEIELLDEEDHPGKTALGEEKHWHLYKIVARKR